MQKVLPQYRMAKQIDIESLTSFFYFEFDDTFVDQFESHEPWELVYVDRGECYVVTDEKRILLSQGEMYFHKPFERHKLEMAKGAYPNVLIITFSTASRAMRYFEDQHIRVGLSTKQHIAAILHEAANTYERPFYPSPDATFRNVVPERRGEGLWGGEQSILIRLELMLIELVRRERYYEGSPRMFHSKEIVTDEFCLKIIGYMEGRLYERMSMDELCRALSFSRSYISKRFSAVCGYSVMEYFTMMKLQEAKRLIRESDRNFQEVSDLLNFANSHYFSTMFKKYVGMTPTQYKKSCKRD